MELSKYIDNLLPGDYSIDNSPHRYYINGKHVIGYEWIVCDNTGAIHRGVESTSDKATNKAKELL